jgi:hypothetical protein
VRDLGKIAVASHDAGGAAVLASYLFMGNLEFTASAIGPSKAVFNQFFCEYDKFSCFKSTEVDTLITSTSATSTHELSIIKQAKIQNVNTISILDHWVNYPERFLRDDNNTLPNEIWVTDRDAFRIASDLFKRVKVRKISNPYKEFLINKHSNFSQYQRNNILYCTEPIKKLYPTQELSYNEFIAIECFFKKLEEIRCEKKIIIKNHPTEQISKYEYLIEKFPNLKIQISSEYDLFEELKSSFFVIGCNTMALVVASWFEIPTLNAIPIGSEQSILKIKDMAYLHSINLQDYIDEIL